MNTTEILMLLGIILVNASALISFFLKIRVKLSELELKIATLDDKVSSQTSDLAHKIINNKVDFNNFKKDNDKKIADLECKFEAGLNKINTKMDKMDEKFDRIDEKITNIIVLLAKNQLQ